MYGRLRAYTDSVIVDLGSPVESHPSIVLPQDVVLFPRVVLSPPVESHLSIKLRPLVESHPSIELPPPVQSHPSTEPPPSVVCDEPKWSTKIKNEEKKRSRRIQQKNQ